jgi:biopolymer transport protein TolR
MAFQNFGERETESELAEINVTPLVDVMLVLLIIFMIAAPLLHPGIEVALPAADAPPLPLRVENPLVVSINRDGIVYLQDAPVHPSQLVERLLPVLEARDDDTVLIKGDREVAYGQVIAVLDVLQKGGVTNLGMVTEDAGGRRRR